MHTDKEKHPTLASDMMEEWRAVIVDSTVMSMINGHEIHQEDFLTDVEEPGCYLTRNGIKIYLSKLEGKKYRELLQRLPAYTSSLDSIRVYKIIGKGQVTSFGRQETDENEEIIVI